MLHLVSWSQRRSGEIFELPSHCNSSTAVHAQPLPGVCPTRHPCLQVSYLEQCGSLSPALEKTKDPPKGWFEINFTVNINPGFLQEGYKHHREGELKKHRVAAGFVHYTERNPVVTVRKF